ncbi:hypothetical protein RUM44_010744 [Polyplax serrata]|uniref:Diacylglycerol kinase n=1 Tax=Polyplax serrata TaxID=468196 RepID=A0ABR1AN20_POLSC
MFNFRFFNASSFIVNSSDLGLHYEFSLPPVVSVATAVTIFILGVKIVRAVFADDRELIKDSSKVHSWKNVATFQGGCISLQSNYCNICEKVIMSGEGMYCDCCGIYSDISCTSIANRREPCKAITWNAQVPMKHHWIQGNLLPSSVCDVCGTNCCGSGFGNFRCCWCLRTIHTACKPHLSELCDFGPYKSLIIPPTSVEVTLKRRSMKKCLVLKSVKPPNWSDWCPLIVITNCKSGSNDGQEVLSAFRGLLHPGQVIDLSKKKPEAALEWCAQLPNTRCKILVAGGDGTIGWVLNSIVKANLPTLPEVGILPLGTGNDLSRVLGWGKGVSPNIEQTMILDNIMNAETVLFDRWKVMIQSSRSLRIHPVCKELFMYNYLSIGVDAQLLYLGYGTQQMIEKKCQGLNERIELYLDGVKKELPAIESIVVLNIDSWGAGVELWKMSETDQNKTEYSYNDGKLEVLALYSSLHIAQLQVGLSVPYRVGQATKIEIKLKHPIAVQVDGEPWLQQPAVFNISHYNQALMLKRN